MYTPSIDEMVAFCGAELKNEDKRSIEYHHGMEFPVLDLYSTIYLKSIDKTLVLESPGGRSDSIGEMFQLEMANHCPEFLVGEYHFCDGASKKVEDIKHYELSATEGSPVGLYVGAISPESYIVKIYGRGANNNYKQVLFVGSMEDCASYAYRLTLCWLKLQQGENNV
jgi:hypothetical protein